MTWLKKQEGALISKQFDLPSRAIERIRQLAKEKGCTQAAVVDYAIYLLADPNSTHRKLEAIETRLAALSDAVERASERSEETAEMVAALTYHLMKELPHPNSDVRPTVTERYRTFMLRVIGAIRDGKSLYRGYFKVEPDKFAAQATADSQTNNAEA